MTAKNGLGRMLVTLGRMRVTHHSDVCLAAVIGHQGQRLVRQPGLIRHDGAVR